MRFPPATRPIDFEPLSAPNRYSARPEPSARELPNGPLCAFTVTDEASYTDPADDEPAGDVVCEVLLQAVAIRAAAAIGAATPASSWESVHDDLLLHRITIRCVSCTLSEP